MELLARFIEQRLCACKLDGKRDAIGAYELVELPDISIGDNGGILDQRICLAREQAIEAPIERHTRNDGHQHGWQGGDYREQSDDAHVEARGRTTAASCLHDAPYFTCN